LDAKTRMRADWEERARRNAFHYIASWKERWESSDFLRYGEEDSLRLVAPMLKACGAEQPSDLMLAIDLLWSGGMPWLGRSLAALFGMDSAAAGRTWRGAAVSAPKIISRVQSVGGEVRLSTGEETPMAWCCGIKKTGPASVC